MALRIGAALAMTGRFARFGRQAAAGLQAWRDLGGAAEIEILDDGSSPASVGPALDALAGRCDLLLGPYGTSPARTAARWARDHDRLVWNHGGAGDDLQAMAPGRLVSVLTPTSRYGEPFLRYLAARHPGTALRLVAGPGAFGRQVVEGMQPVAESLGIPLSDTGDSLFAAGTFDHDIQLITDAAPRPAVVGCVAAGVLAFAEAVPDPEEMLGVAQWMPRRPGAGRVAEIGPADCAKTGPDIGPDIGPAEEAFVARYRTLTGSDPDYPAVQAAAAAAIAVHCATLAGTTDPDDLWDTAAALRTTTLYGAFGIDPATGAQTDHSVTLVQWRAGRPEPL